MIYLILLAASLAQANAVQEAVQVETIRLSEYGVRPFPDPKFLDFDDVQYNHAVRRPTVALAHATNAALHIAEVANEARHNAFKVKVEAGPLDIVCIKGRVSRVFLLHGHILAVVQPRAVRETMNNILHLIGAAGRIPQRQKTEINRRLK